MIIKFLHILFPIALCFTAVNLVAQSYPPVNPLQRTFHVPDIGKANVWLDIKSMKGTPIYKLQCHSAGYTDDPDFDYSGDFECRLSSIGVHDKYSTLLTENVHQSRDWESRGRFFSTNLRNECANIPEFGAIRNFRFRGMRLTLHIIDPVFTEGGKLSALKMTVTIHPDSKARRPIAEIVKIPKTGVQAGCRLQEYFIDPAE